MSVNIFHVFFSVGISKRGWVQIDSNCETLAEQVAVSQSIYTSPVGIHASYGVQSLTCQCGGHAKCYNRGFPCYWPKSPITVSR